MNFIEFQTDQKLRGGYYTSEDLADFLVRWIASTNPNSILEPSCGDGVFFERIAAHLQDPSITAFEIESAEAHKARARANDLGLSDVEIQAKDFLGWATKAIEDRSVHFDAALGNPPFIRYQYLPFLFQDRAESIFRQLECKFTKHTNAWVPFVMASFALLRPGGRLAMVVPAEIIHVLHAQSLRSYLCENSRRIVIIDPEEIWFSETLQGAVILLAEKKHHGSEDGDGVGIYPVRGREFVDLDPQAVFDRTKPVNGKVVEGKWTPALLDVRSRALLDELVEFKSVRRFDQVAEVDIGIVTGANKFFLVDDSTVRNFDLDRWAYPMFGRSDHCPGVIYDSNQHIANACNGKPTNFLWFKDSDVEETSSGRAYIRLGESQGLDSRYKCRIRKRWYSVPSVYATEVGMLKRSHYAPRLILNRLGAYTTDTCYRIRVRKVNAALLVFCFLNPLTALSAELEGRHYGGGVLELVPSEIERLLIPLAANVNVDIEGLNAMIRSSPIGDVLECQGSVVLGGVGLSAVDQEALMDAWQRLRRRRHRVSHQASSRFR